VNPVNPDKEEEKHLFLGDGHHPVPRSLPDLC
jgi:hypothetical protein